ncbi:hypothetical protein C1I97_09385 [Streptomyces sp. NTH33]|uniref:hypothetical protein n=1 Tax=Streptomyces sp. NTH33 TaxID=1735453 RepID=UPI000DA88385|nr:hypothetical protein [Streptomyces sp. NTH33]PZH14940.1 hypothetical protein C1I97_09385 [Streptomyces sp. NTH33]
MLNSKKIAAAAAGVLGGFVLIGAGAVQSFAGGNAGKCTDDGMGNRRCVQVSEYQITTDKRGNVTVINHSTQSCPAAGGGITCVSGASVPGRQS